MLMLVILEFLKIGLFSIGGGLATIPFLYHLAQVHPSWITQTKLTDILAVAQSTPGPIGVNISTYVGYSILGFFGSIIAPFALVLPSIIIILIIVHFFNKYEDNQIVKHYFKYIRVASIALILYASTFIIKPALFVNSTINYLYLSIFIVFFILENIFSKLSPIVFILLASIVAILLF